MEGNGKPDEIKGMEPLAYLLTAILGLAIFVVLTIVTMGATLVIAFIASLVALFILLQLAIDRLLKIKRRE